MSAARMRRRIAGRLGAGGGPGWDRAPALFPPEPQVLQEGEGEPAQERVVVQPAPGAALEVVQAGRALELVIVLLDPPAQLAQAGQFNHWRGPGEVRQPVLDRLGLVGQATRPAANARAAPTPVAGDWPGRVELRP